MTPDHIRWASGNPSYRRPDTVSAIAVVALIALAAATAAVGVWL